MMRFRDTALQLGGHLIATAALMSCWLAGFTAWQIVAVCTVIGGIAHTLVDTTIDPDRGRGGMLRVTVISNVLFSALMSLPWAVTLPHL